MAKNKRTRQKSKELVREPWISSRTGIFVITGLSLAVGVFTGITVYPVQGMTSALEWGLGSAAGLWVFFGGAYLFNRILGSR